MNNLKEYDLKQTNREILKGIINNPGTSRAQLAKIFDLNKSTTSYITRELSDEGLIEFYRGINEEGRKGTYIRINPDYEQVLFVEYLKNRFKFYVCRLDGSIIDRFITEKFIDNNHLNVLERYLKMITAVYVEINNCIMAVHGSVDKINYIMKSPFYDISIKDLNEVFDTFNINLHVENETNVYAIGLYKLGDTSTSVTIKIKDGVGSGIIINKSLFTGDMGIAGEIGHLPVGDKGKKANKCACGRTDCLETYVSESVVLDRIEDILGVGDIEVEQLSSSVVKDKKIQMILDRNICILADAIYTISTVLNPSKVLIVSDLYSQIDNIDQKLQVEFKKMLIPMPNIEVYETSEKKYIRGFVKLYLQLVV